METLLRTDVQALCGCSVRHNAKQHLLISCHLQILILNAALPRWRFCYRRIKASPWNMTMAHKDKGVHLKLSRWNNTICVTVPVNTSTFNAISWHFCTDRLCSGTRRTIRRTETTALQKVTRTVTSQESVNLRPSPLKQQDPSPL